MEKLIYVDDSLPGITRRGAGTGFAYYCPKGIRIEDRHERARLNAIALPPAYRDAWFCPAENGHILATGYDDRGRKQYRYHPEFRTMREGEKFDQCAAFGRLLPLMRKRVREDLEQPHVTESCALAAVVRLLDLSAIRIGNEHYTQQNGSYGATTLRREHVDMDSHGFTLNFTGKGGKDRDIDLDDPGLAKAIRRMSDLPAADKDRHLFRYCTSDRETRSVNSGAVNEYIGATMGGDFTAKHFRTWHASVLAFETLVDGDGELPIRALLERVAERLGNTEAIARKSYIHPAVIERVEGQAQWRDQLRLPRKTQWQSAAERGLIELLEESPEAAELLTA
ncbi:MAG: DNA topoisomerase IB [Pseudomonadota bacterium]